MKIGIFCNFSLPHCGGSEFVIQNISERLVANYKYIIDVYSYSCHSHYNVKGVNYIPCKRGDGLISQINENDHIFVYSDSFFGWDTMLEIQTQ